jgi:hypothetical protein
MNEKRVEFLLKYRELLANGRVKPDKFGKVPYVRDSLEGIYMITRIDEVLKQELNIKEDGEF